MHDTTFGELTYEYGWTRPYAISLFGQVWAARLMVPCDEGEEIEPTQRIAFERFELSRDRLLIEAEETMFSHYQDISGEYRERLGKVYADKLAPVIDEVSDLGILVRPTELIVQQSFGSQKRVVGLLLWCSWNPSLGLAVKFVDEEIEEVGPQDIVL